MSTFIKTPKGLLNLKGLYQRLYGMTNISPIGQFLAHGQCPLL